VYTLALPRLGKAYQADPGGWAEMDAQRQTDRNCTTCNTNCIKYNSRCLMSITNAKGEPMRIRN